MGPAPRRSRGRLTNGDRGRDQGLHGAERRRARRDGRHLRRRARRLRGRAAVEAARRSGCSSPSPATTASSTGFSFCTLERIGGTPCVLIGLASVKRTVEARRRAQGGHARPVPPGRAGLPRRGRARRHPLPSTLRLRGVQGRLKDIVPRPGHKATGEERAWGRRLAKRFGVEGTYDEHGFSVKGDGGRRPRARPRDAEARGDPGRRRCVLQGLQRRTGATASSPSAGPWPKTSPSSPRRGSGASSQGAGNRPPPTAPA